MVFFGVIQIWKPSVSKRPDFFEIRDPSSGQIQDTPASHALAAQTISCNILGRLTPQELGSTQLVCSRFSTMTKEYYCDHVRRLFSDVEVQEMASCFGYDLPESVTSENVKSLIGKLAERFGEVCVCLYDERPSKKLVSRALFDIERLQMLFRIMKRDNTVNFFWGCEVCGKVGVSTDFIREEFKKYIARVRTHITFRTLDNLPRMSKIQSLGASSEGVRAYWLPEELKKLSSLEAISLIGMESICFPKHLSLPGLKVFVLNKEGVVKDVSKRVDEVITDFPRNGAGMCHSGASLARDVLRALENRSQT
jgi:hypothetical protein